MQRSVSAPIGERRSCWRLLRGVDHQVEIGAVADDDVGLPDGGGRGRGAMPGIARADARRRPDARRDGLAGPRRRSRRAPRRFSTTRWAADPAARRAAASATDAVPTAACTTGLGFGTATPARAAAGKSAQGHPVGWASRAIAGSPVLRSSVATRPTASGCRPEAARVSATSRSRPSGSAPELAPDPEHERRRPQHHLRSPPGGHPVGDAHPVGPDPLTEQLGGQGPAGQGGIGGDQRRRPVQPLAGHAGDVALGPEAREGCRGRQGRRHRSRW